MNISDLTICSVVYTKNHLKLLELNRDFTLKINSIKKINWLLINNSPPEENLTFSKNFKVIKGAKRSFTIKASASYNHAEGVNLALKYVKSRYLLVLDTDFFIVRKNWIREILQYMNVTKLDFFGAPFHPKWFDKYRYFPSVHCIFIDLKRVKKNQLDFRPEINEKPEYFLKLIFLLLGLKKQFIIGNSKDTGVRIYNKFKKSNHQSALPVFLVNQDVLETRPVHPLTQKIKNLIPERLSFLPKKAASYALKKFIEFGYPDLYQAGLEEFIWLNEPFAFHLRGKKKETENPNFYYHLIQKALTRILAINQLTKSAK